MDASASSATFSVHVRGARIVFDGEALFDGLDFTLEGGRWTCLLGASGVGKTTLLRTILGLAPSSGNGDEVSCSDGLPLAGRAAFMAQQDLLLPWLTVAGNVTLGSRLRSQPDPDTGKALRLLDDVGLAGYAEARPAALSGGMRQRAALARTLMEDRPVVLMDEPFSGLDALTKMRLQDMAARVLEGRSVLLVTHDPLEALRLGHRILILAGRPARVIEALEPEGNPPRDVTDTGLLRMQGTLLKMLGEARDGAA